jgi:hypothetical protein
MKMLPTRSYKALSTWTRTLIFKALWENRAMGRTWRAWVLFVMEQKRLRFARQKVVARWKVTFVFVCLSDRACVWYLV